MDPRLREAASALERRDYLTALAAAEKARKEGAPLADALRLKADVFRETAYLDLEIQSLKHWSRERPTDPAPLVRLAYIFLDLGWRREADKAAQEALVRAPNSVRALMVQASVHYRSAEPARALPFIIKAREIGPENPEFANLHAMTLLKARRFPEAEKAAREALSRHPASVPLHIALGHALSYQGNAGAAAAEFDEALRRDPQNLEALFQAASLSAKLGDEKSALDKFEKAAAIDVQFGNVAYRLGNLYVKNGRVAEGRKLLGLFRKMEASTSAYETALSQVNTRPNDADAHYRVARIHLDAGEYSQAIVELKSAWDLNPKHARALPDLILALGRNGRSTEARALLKRYRQAEK